MKRIVVAFFILLYAGLWCIQQAPAAGWMPLFKAASGGLTVALVDTGTAGQSGGAVTTYSSTPITVSGLSNGGLLCSCTWQNDGVTGQTATWNGTSMTLVPSAIVTTGNGCSPSCGVMAFFGLVAPASGANTLAVNWTTATRVVVDCWSFSGVNQTSFATAFTHGLSKTALGSGGASTAGSTGNITSATGDLAIGGFASGDGVATVSTVTPGGETQLYLTTTLGAFSSGANFKVGAGAVNLTSTFSQSTAWGAIGFDLVHQ